MHIGISIASSYAVTQPRDGARWMLERVQAAAKAGLDSLFFGDHHATTTPYYQNTPMLGRALAEWTHAPAGALYLLPFHHPVLLAEEVATLAAISAQPFILQCALGYGDREFAAFGINPSHRPSRFEESLAILRRLWAGETVTHQGRWQFQQAQISPLPPEPIQVWIAASAPPAIQRAARLGDGWLAAPGLTPREAQESLALYHEACAAAGRPPGVTAIRRDIYVGTDPQDGQTVGDGILGAGYRGFAPEAVIYGDAQQVADAFLDLAHMGFSHVIVRSLVTEQSTALASIARLAQVKKLVQIHLTR